ncbi:MAG: hypothetical protein KGP14_01025 [Betaproteobacteria bacterium]|nr:hypothetical protein [Betaproteobacteria bacterium]
MAEAEFHWNVPADHPAFPGHFPGHPIVPGVVLLDRAVLFAEELLCRSGLNWQIGNAKFFSPVGPEEALTFSLLQKPSGTITFTVRAVDREVATGSLTPPAP